LTALWDWVALFVIGISGLSQHGCHEQYPDSP